MYYKFRAECRADVLLFINKLIELDRLAEIVSFNDGEKVVIGVRGYVLKSLIRVANELEDCHVIAQTINLEKDYTGERDFSV